MSKDQSEFSKSEELTALLNKEGEEIIEPSTIKTNNQQIDVNQIYHDPSPNNFTLTEDDLLNHKQPIPQENTTNNLIMETLNSSTRMNRESLVSWITKLNQETFIKHYTELLTFFQNKGKIFPLVYYLTNNDLLQDLTNFMHEINPLEYEDYEDCLFLIAEYFSSSKNSEKTKNPQRIDVVFNVIVNNLCKGKLHDSWIPMLSITVRKLTRNQMNQAISLVNFMICYQIEIFTQAINFLFEELGKLLVIDELIKLFEKMLVFSAKFQFHSKNSFSPTRINMNSGVDYSTFIIVIRILCKTSSLQLAKNYYFLLKSNKMIKDDSIFQIFIESCNKNNKIEEIKGFYNEMLYFSLKPSLTTFNIIIEAFVKSKNIDAAWKIYFDMIQGGQEPDSFTYTAIFKGIKETSHLPFLNKAFDIIESFVQRKEKFDIIIINVLIDSCFSLKELELAECLFDKVVSLYFKVEPDIITYNTYIKGCAQNAYYEKALEAFDKIPSEVVPNDVTVNTMIDICVRIGNHDKKQEFINLLGQYEIKPDNFTYSTIIKGMNKKNNTLSEAFQLFETAKKYSKADEILYNCIMDACLRFGEIDKMLDVFEEMKRFGIRASSISYGICIKAYGMKRDLSKSLEVYEIMKKDKVEISAVTYGCLINACIKCENLTKAFELFEELNKSGIGKNCILYTTLITAYSKVRNVNKVLEIFDKMKLDKDNSPNNVTYNSVLNCLVTNDYLEIAEKILDELCSHKTLKPDIISFSTLIKGYIYQKDLRKPLKILSMMERLNIKPDEVLLNSLLDGCDKMNNYKAGVEIFRQVRKFIYPSLMSFSIMMKIYGKLGDYEESRNLINELRKNDEKISLIIYTCYMRTCFNNKRAEEAMEIFREISSKKIEPDHVTFKTLIIGFTNCKCSDYSLISLNSSISAQVRLDFEVYDKALWFLSTSSKDEEISSILQKLRNMNVHMNPKKYLKNHQVLKKEAVRTVGFDYLLENYKFKKDENVNEDNRTFANSKKPVSNFNQDEKGKFIEISCNVIGASVNKELSNEKFSKITPDNLFAMKIKGFGKDLRKPFNTVSTVNSVQTQPVLSKGFERGTKLSSYKIPSNPVISVNENEIKKKEKVHRINRF